MSRFRACDVVVFPVRVGPHIPREQYVRVRHAIQVPKFAGLISVEDPAACPSGVECRGSGEETSAVRPHSSRFTAGRPISTVSADQ